MSIEIDQLNSRLVDAETKLKTEIQRIRKKMMITITELEMTLDVSNKNNIELQKTIKKQSLQLTVSFDSRWRHSFVFPLCHLPIDFFFWFHLIFQELQSMYEETQRQLQITMDQYGVAQRRLQTLQQEMEDMRANMEGVRCNTLKFLRKKINYNFPNRPYALGALLSKWPKMPVLALTSWLPSTLTFLQFVLNWNKNYPFMPPTSKKPAKNWRYSQ